MAFTNSPLVSYTRISPNRNVGRNQPISKITIHHCAGCLSVEQFGEIVANPNRQMSANYCVGNDGRIGLYCPESDRSWCSSSPWNDHRAITIEVSNNINCEPWSISDAAYTSLIKLCIDICKRNGIKKLEFTGNQNGSLTYHYMFAATGCPGTWIKNHTTDLCNKVNAQLNAVEPTPKPQAQTNTSFKVGDLVSINANAKYYNGGSIPSWVLQSKWYISSVSGDRAVLGKSEGGDKNIQSPIKTTDIKLVNTAPTGTIISLKKGVTIFDVAGGKKLGVVDADGKYTIVEEKTVDNIKYGKLKSGAGWVELEKLKRTFNINNANDVKELQTALNKRGFNCGAVDGDVGKNTTNAMFQALCDAWLQNK